MAANRPRGLTALAASPGARDSEVARFSPAPPACLMTNAGVTVSKGWRRRDRFRRQGAPADLLPGVRPACILASTAAFCTLIDPSATSFPAWSLVMTEARYALPGLLVLLASSVVGVTAQRGDPPAFRARVDLVSLNVTVTGQSNRFLTDLDEHEFVVLEDGTPQEIVFFSRAPIPVALALLIDTSASMHAKLPLAQEAAIGFVRNLGPDDVAAVIEFDSRVRFAQEFTSDQEALERAIRATETRGSTSLYNAIYVALKELDRMRAAEASHEIRRQAILVLSDGEDTSSLLTFDDALDLAKRSHTAIYTIGLRPVDLIGQRAWRDVEFELRRFARETGGQAFFPDRATDLAGVYARIGQELSSQYTLAYASDNPDSDGRWRRLEVRVTRPNAAVRARFGYYAAASQ
jgi:Ca-activated chloride channel homolog